MEDFISIKSFFNLHWMMKNIKLFNVCEAQSIFKKYWTMFVKEKPTEPWHENSNDVVCATSKASDQPAHMRSLIRVFASHLNILWLSIYWLNILCSFYALKGLHRLVWVYTCQNATLLEITCRGSTYSNSEKKSTISYSEELLNQPSNISEIDPLKLLLTNIVTHFQKIVTQNRFNCQ